MRSINARCSGVGSGSSHPTARLIGVAIDVQPSGDCCYSARHAAPRVRIALPRSASPTLASCVATRVGTRFRHDYAGSKSMIRMIATVLPLFWVPSVVMPLAQVQTSPFFTVNCFAFCTTANSPSVM